MPYKKALQIKNYSEEISYKQLIEKTGDFGLRLPLYNFQVKGFLYLLAAKRAILADSTGLGKTVQSIALIQWLEHIKVSDNRWLLVVPPSVALQWADEFARFSSLPPPVLGIGGRRERISYYVSGFWQILILSYQVLWRDWELVKDLGITNYIFDDGHFFRHHSTKTAQIVKLLTKDAKRVIITTATPIQKSVMDLHSLLEALGLGTIFGSQIGFENHYCITKKTHYTLRDGREFWKKEIVGMRNREELQRKIRSYYLKRTFAEVGEQLPSLVVKPLRVSLLPRQQKIYDQLRLKIIKAWDEGRIKEIPNKGFHSLIQSCLGTRAVGLEDDISVKADLVEQFIEDKLGKEKVIVYSFYKEPIRALARRLKKAGRKFVMITGDDASKKKREAVRHQFMEDSETQVLLGTDCIEGGLNLQAARYLIMLNLILNPQRITQLIGRLRRLGSKHKSIVVYPLLAKDTLEEALWRRLKYEAALSDIVFKEKSDVFSSLTATELMTLIRG